MTDDKYIRLQKRDKIPLDRWRQPENQYSWAEIAYWVAAGGNVGFVCGDTVVLDIDNTERAEELGIKPAATKIARTARGLHYYYKCPEATKTIFYDREDQSHLGELQCLGQYVVSPPSWHPSGIQYKWVSNLEVTEVTCSEIMSWFKGKATTTKRPPSNTVLWDRLQTDMPFHLQDIWRLDGFKKTGGELIGPHPVHGSTTGRNFAVRGDVWHCFRCGTGGGPLEALAIDAGLMRCEESQAGCLKNYKWFLLCAEAKKRGLI